MVIAVAIALMREQLLIAARDDLHRAVGDGRRMNRSPHAHALPPVLNAKIGVILMPRGAFAEMSRLQENLVQLPDDWLTDQLADGIDDLARKAKRAKKFAFGRNRTDLEIKGSRGFCLAIACPCNVVEQAIIF
jgi:hypothetical protein